MAWLFSLFRVLTVCNNWYHNHHSSPICVVIVSRCNVLQSTHDMPLCLVCPLHMQMTINLFLLFAPWLLWKRSHSTQQQALVSSPLHALVISLLEAQCMDLHHKTLVTPWIISSIFQLTMKDPVKVMLVTLLIHW